jgi:hypothetical protein
MALPRTLADEARVRVAILVFGSEAKPRNERSDKSRAVAMASDI